MSTELLFGPSGPPDEAPQAPSKSYGNYYIVTTDNGKLASLLTFLQFTKVGKAIIFLPTYWAVSYWASMMPHLLQEPTVFGLYGKMKQKLTSIMDNYKNAETGILLCTEATYKKFDVPEPDWVIQWDPPSDESEYTLRVVRIARLGVEQSTLILLTETERGFVPHLEQAHRIKLLPEENKASPSLPFQLMEKMRAPQKLDRSLFDKAEWAFTRHINAYSPITEVPFVDLAVTYGLFRIPETCGLSPEIVKAFPAPKNFDINSIKYTNQAREHNRHRDEAYFKFNGKMPGSRQPPELQKPGEAWTKSKIKRELRKAKLHKKQVKMSGRFSGFRGFEPTSGDI